VKSGNKFQGKRTNFKILLRFQGIAMKFIKTYRR